MWNPYFLTQFQILLMHPNHSTLIIYAIWLKFYILKILSRKKSSYETSTITLWFWFVKHGWRFAKNLYIEKENYEFAIKIKIDKVYYVKYYCWAWLWWKILYSFFFFFFLVLYICMLYTQLYNVCILIRV